MYRSVSFAALAVLLAAAPIAGRADDALRPVAHDVDVKLDPAASTLVASDTIELDRATGGVLRLALHPALEVDAVEVGDRPCEWQLAEAGGGRSPRTLRIDVPTGARAVRVRWHGKLLQATEGARFARDTSEAGIDATIGPGGTFLAPSACWYPTGTGLASYRLAIAVPAGQEALAEGERLERTEANGVVRAVFRTELPLDGVHCIAGPYVLVERRAGDVALYAYVYEADRELAAPYLDDVERYLALYRELLGPYPFRKFAVAEAFFPAGYGMPSFTYLGQQVMRLPFIRATSLGHEVAHNWWGNGVLVDAAEGNWCEGLTTYHADYLYELRKSADAARVYRQRVLADYAAYVGAGKDIALREFRARHDAATRAVGYGKAMMVFEMLALRIGRERLDAALREVVRTRVGKETAWRHLRQAVEDAAGEDLGWWFAQWIERAGAPSIALADVALTPDAEAGAMRVRFALRADASWRLELPVEVRYASGRVVARTVEGVIGPEGRSFDWLLTGDERPVSLAVDPELRTMRRMDAAEVPATLRVLLGAAGVSIALPGGAAVDAAAAYGRLADGMTERLAGAKRIDAAGDLPAGPVLVLGTSAENPWARALLDVAGTRVEVGETWRLDETRVAGDGAALVVAVRRPGGAIAVLVMGRSASAIDAIAAKLVHYGRDGALLFDGGRMVARGVLDAPTSPLVHRFDLAEPAGR